MFRNFFMIKPFKNFAAGSPTSIETHGTKRPYYEKQGSSHINGFWGKGTNKIKRTIV